MLQTKNFNIELKADFGHIINLQNSVRAERGNTNLRKYISTAIEDLDILALTKIVTNLGDIAYVEAMEFFNEWNAGGKTPKELFEEVAKVINDAGFFGEKLKSEDIINELTSTDSKMNNIDLAAITTKAAEEAVKNLVDAQMPKAKKSK